MKVSGPRTALLLIGPTGSGKSPLGAALEKLLGWPHFDFGHILRKISTGNDDLGLDPSDRAFVGGLLKMHALFPDEKFSIVEKILKSFLEKNSRAGGIILNGLPRHTGQARDIAPLVDVKTVAVLDCGAKAADRRVRLRAAGLTSDHSGRSDDTPAALTKKMQIFERDTRPLIDYYRAAGAKIIFIHVDERTGEGDMARLILDSMNAKGER